MATGTRNADKGHPCLGCGKNCTGQQYSVYCTLCKLWCHRECAGISDKNKNKDKRRRSSTVDDIEVDDSGSGRKGEKRIVKGTVREGN